MVVSKLLDKFLTFDLKNIVDSFTANLYVTQVACLWKCTQLSWIYKTSETIYEVTLTTMNAENLDVIKN